MTDTPSPIHTLPVATEGAPAPLDPVIKEMIDHHAGCTVWPYVDNKATNRKLEKMKKAHPNLNLTRDNCRVFKRHPKELAGAKASIKHLNPQDAVEAMLSSQITAVYLASIECLDKASWTIDNIENRIAYLNAASKLGRTFADLSKAFDHHRGKSVSEQKITVQYVNVADGGQAVIGSVNRPAEGGAEQNGQ